MTNISWNSRNFKVIVEATDVYGTACEEWTGWDLKGREEYLDRLFGRGNWTWH